MACVYKHSNLGGIVFYIGKSKENKSRPYQINKNHRSAWWIKAFNELCGGRKENLKIDIIKCKTEGEALKLEWDLITKEKPEANRQYLQNETQENNEKDKNYIKEYYCDHDLFGLKIKQNLRTLFFSGTDLSNAGNKWRRENGLSDFNMAIWLKGSSTEEFINELELKYKAKAVVKSRGRNGGTWLHPLLFIDMALAISPKLKIETYQWLFDNLIKNRNMSGDSYKLMCGVLFIRHGDKKTFGNHISQLADKIKKTCGVYTWETATDEQLLMRDMIHKDIAWLADSLNNNQQAVRMALSRFN